MANRRTKRDANPVKKGLERLAEKRADNWQNPFTGLGTDRDKVYQGTYFAPYRLQDTELLALFNGSDIAATIVEHGYEEMLKRGYEISVDEDATDKDVDPEELSGLKKTANKLRLNELLTDAGVWGELFGGSLMILGAQDGRRMDQPLNEQAISTVRYFNVIDRRFIYVHTYYSNPLEPNYGLPETYLISNSVSGNSGGTGSVVIHESRCIRFDGARTDILTRQQLAGWTWSRLQRAYEQLRNFESAFQAVGNLMTDASQAVFKLKNLIAMIAAGEKDVLQERMALVDMSRSVCRAVLVDAEDEEFRRETTSFAGLPDVLDRFMMRLSAAVKIPVAILLGRSAAGMNATGDLDFRAYYGRLTVRREKEVGPKLSRIYHVLSLAKDSATGGADLEFKFTFPSLWDPTDSDQADVELKTAQKDQIYLTTGVLSPEEVKLARWGKGTFSTATPIDVERAKAEMDDQNMMGNMVQPPPEFQGQDPGAQGEQQTPVTTVPGPVGGAAGPPQEPNGAMTSPYVGTKNPVTAVAKMYAPPKTPKQG